MTDIILSSFISLFALLGKEENVDEKQAKVMLISYLRHHLGIRNADAYVTLYDDMRQTYEMADNLNTAEVVGSICTNLYGKIRSRDGAFLLLRLMEFGHNEQKAHHVDCPGHADYVKNMVTGRGKKLITCCCTSRRDGMAC